MKEGKILYALNNRQMFFKLFGRITYPISQSFDNFINEVFNKDLAVRFLIDLRETNYIDSTNLGLLAKVSIKAKKKNREKPVIISNNENVNVILKTMGFYDVFVIVKDHDPINNVFTELSDLTNNEKELAKVMLGAHESLAEMNDKNKTDFCNVIDALKKEIK